MTDSSLTSGFSFDRIQGQSRPITLLRDAVRNGRISQAYLFHGPWGVGKTTAALALATALNCEGDEKPCGTCVACRKTSRFNHPDVHVVMPLYPASLWKAEAEKGTAEEPGESPLCRLYGEWVGNPFHVFSWSKRPTIATEWILQIRREASRKTFEGRTKVIIISGVESMSVEAANRILKMLEEPGPSTVFILTTSRLHGVLPTIRSRCQRVAFGGVPAEVIRGILTDHLGTDAADASLVATLARGSVARAISLHEEGILELREWTLGLVRLEEPQLIDTLSEDVLGNSRRWNGRTVRHVAEILMAWYRDLLAVRHGSSEEQLANQDCIAELKAQASHLDVLDVKRRIRLLESLIQDVEHQVTPSLALFAALTDTGTGIHADPVG
jgi:DNA polymerase-3 subunit delta'